MKLPKARTENLVEQNLGAEMLIYDLLVDKAFNLNETLSIVYKACDGKTTFDELKSKYKFTDDFIYLALDELKRANLMADDAVYHSPFTGASRREVIKRIGLTSAVALPLIFGLIAPKAVHAASGAQVTCVSQNPCSCSATNTTGDGALCGADLGGTSTGCGSSFPNDGCDCIIQDGTDQGACATPIIIFPPE